MSTRITLMAIAVLASAIALPATATTGSTFVGGEAGFKRHAMPATKTFAQVQQELAGWRADPVTADGWRQVGGEAGTVYVGPSASGKSRTEVNRDVLQANRNPVGNDGWVDVGGEAGAVFIGFADSRMKMAGPDGQSCIHMAGGMNRSGHMAGGPARTC